AAAWLGRVLAVGVLLLAVVKPSGFGSSAIGTAYLVILAMFIWANASIAITQAKVIGVLPGIDIRALTRRALPVTAELPLAEAVRRAREAGARALVVVDGNGRPNGIVSEAAVSAMPQQRQPWVPVSDLSRPIDDGLVLRADMTGEALVQAVAPTMRARFPDWTISDRAIAAEVKYMDQELAGTKKRPIPQPD
ncbi:MAG TPA: CBS domain-containing protein, partial [Sphingomicrobium sp.]